MVNSTGETTKKLSIFLGDLIKKQEQVKEAKKALKEAIKETEDVELKDRIKELKNNRKELSAQIKEMQEELERQVLGDNPDIKALRERVLEVEEEVADLKVQVRETSAPLLEKKALVEVEVRGEGEMPTRVQLMRGVVAAINGREQML